MNRQRTEVITFIPHVTFSKCTQLQELAFVVDRHGLSDCTSRVAWGKTPTISFMSAARYWDTKYKTADGLCEWYS